jgi:predicted nucleic acid-binding Zn ribbon protein
MKPIAAAVPGAIAAMLRSGPLSPGKVDFAWNAVVGPALQRVTAVRLENGVLFVDAASAQWAREVARSSGMILKRMQAMLGDERVKEISVRDSR